MSRESSLVYFDKQLRYRRAIGHTYDEIVAWLAEQSVEVNVSTVWRYLNRPNRGPGADENRKHERWRLLRKGGWTLEAIAKAAGVSKQAVHEALKRLDTKDTVTP